jgi:hypothetical protein
MLVALREAADRWMTWRGGKPATKLEKVREFLTVFIYLDYVEVQASQPSVPQHFGTSTEYPLCHSKYDNPVFPSLDAMTIIFLASYMCKNDNIMLPFFVD